MLLLSNCGWKVLEKYICCRLLHIKKITTYLKVVTFQRSKSERLVPLHYRCLWYLSNYVLARIMRLEFNPQPKVSTTFL
jgi:hypothetical protein